jgi:hypothetical protein
MIETRMINCWSEVSALWSTTSHFSPESDLIAKSRTGKFLSSIRALGSTSLAQTSTAYQEKDLRIKTHCKETAA